MAAKRKQHQQPQLPGFGDGPEDERGPNERGQTERGQDGPSESSRTERAAGPESRPALPAIKPAIEPAIKSAIERATEPVPARSLQGQTVYVLDAHSLIYQVFHALPEMSGPAGQPVGAIHGFLRDIVDILERRRPDYLICAFDPPGDTFRHGLYDQYKAERASMPEDLRSQIPNIQRFLAALAIPVLAVPGYEADDVLATLSAMTYELGGECLLVTNDKDCRQLINERVKVFNIRKQEVVDAAAVEQHWGIRPDQVVDFQALMGDSTDNVPGIRGIGEKTAAQLLNQFDTLEAVWERVEEVARPKLRELLTGGREMALLSRELVRLAKDVPLQLDWQAAHVGGIDLPAALELCSEFGLHSLPKRLSELFVTAAPAVWTAQYETVATEPGLQELVATLGQQKRISVDTETTSAHAREAQLVGCSFAWRPGHAVYVPLRAPQGDPCLDASMVLEALRPVLEDPAIEKIGQNIKYDMIVLRGAGITLRGARFDTMVADYLLAPGERSHSVDDMAKRYLNHETIRIRELIGTGRTQRRMDEVPVSLVTPYASQDADIPLRLAKILGDRLRDDDLEELFEQLEMPLVEVLADMEYCGIRVDVPLLGKLSRQYGERMAELEAEIYALAGHPFNLDSPKQLAQVLFKELGLPTVRRTKTGDSTDAEVLEELAPRHPLPAKVIEYRQQSKLKSTYVDALPVLVLPETGRVHTSFKQDVAATGRLSSTDPNLQNIPVRSRDGREIRAAFVPGDPSWQLLCADYSQIELRVLAHCSQDAALLQAFATDQDIHSQVAGQVYGVPPEAVTKDMRRAAKAINFGIIYGQSAFGLAKSLGIAKSEAAEFIDAYFARYPGVEVFMERILDECREKGYVTTTLGRRRGIQGVRDAVERQKHRQRTMPERIAINTVIQGSAADLIKIAMIRLHRRLKQASFRAQLLLQIHDELVLEVPPDELDRVSRLVAEEMSGVGNLSVRLKVDLKAGANWADCEPLD